jgi:hypothetical protein
MSAVANGVQRAQRDSFEVSQSQHIDIFACFCHLVFQRLLVVTSFIKVSPYV